MEDGREIKQQSMHKDGWQELGGVNASIFRVKSMNMERYTRKYQA